jgi:hypothetical protein
MLMTQKAEADAREAAEENTSPVPKDDPMLAGLDLPEHRKWGRSDQVASRRRANSMIRRGMHPYREP